MCICLPIRRDPFASRTGNRARIDLCVGAGDDMTRFFPKGSASGRALSVVGWALRVAFSFLIIAFHGRLLGCGTCDAKGIEAQFKFVDASLEAGAASRMQRVFPEGYFFMRPLRRGRAHHRYR